MDKTFATAKETTMEELQTDSRGVTLWGRLVMYLNRFDVAELRGEFAIEFGHEVPRGALRTGSSIALARRCTSPASAGTFIRASSSCPRCSSTAHLQVAKELENVREPGKREKDDP